MPSFLNLFSSQGRLLRGIGLAFATLAFTIVLAQNAQAAACPATDGGAGDGDGTANGIITINANTTWNPVDATAWDCSSLDLLVTNNATLTFGSVTASGYYGYLQINDLQIDSGASISSNSKGCITGTGTNGFGPNGSNVCTVSTAGYGRGTDTWAGGGGGAYGGAGGAGTGGSTPGSTAYGSSTAPTLFGSSGGQSNNASYNIAGAGGGVIRLNISGNFTFNGTLSANGGAGATADGSNRAGGGGSGGSIYVTVGGDLSGTTGSLSAVGGAGGNNGSHDGGGGGGGRIALVYSSSSFSGLGSEDFSVSGGSGPDAAIDGTKGTVYVLNSTSDEVSIYHGFTYASDYSASSWTADATATNQTCDGSDATPSVTTTGAISLMGTFNCTNASVTGLDFSPGGPVTFNALTLNMSAQDIFTIDEAVDVTVTGNSTITANVQWTNLSNLTLDAGSSIRANSLGCTTGTGTHGFGPNGSNVCTVSTAGYGRGTDTWAGGGGGAYGGAGGAGTGGSTPGGSTYGSSTAPTLFGSSGGQSNNAAYNIAGAGGGLIRLNITGNFGFRGALSANGGQGATADGSNRAGGGGSGGSIYVTVGGSLSGTTGSLSAVGGAGGNNGSHDGGGGGGGRVYFTYAQLSGFSGSFSTGTIVAGGFGPDAAVDGGVGSFSFIQVVTLSSLTITDNSGYTNDTTPVLTLSQSGATPTHVAFSCNGGSNWSAWLAYPDDNVVNDDDGPAFNMASDATGCSGSDGLKTISAKIKDGSSESSSVSDSTTLDTTAPTVSNVSSTNANGTYGAAEVITVTVQFSDTTMQVTGTPQIQLDMDGTDRQANHASTSTDTLSFTYTIATGDNKADLDYTTTNALTLNGGTITDLAGNTATLTLATPGAAGSLGANKAINIVTNQAPTVSSITAAQEADGSGLVTIEFTVDDPDNDDTLQVQVEYSLDGGSTWDDPTLSVVDGDTAFAFGDPDVDNAQTRQVGQTGAYLLSSSGANAGSIVWNASTDIDASTDISNARIRLTPYDGTIEGGTGTSANFIIDLVNPTGLAGLEDTDFGSSYITLTWTAAVDSNFNHYEIWYGQNETDVGNRSGSASEWDDGSDASLATASTTTTTVSTNPRNVYFQIFAVDDFGNEASSSSYFRSYRSGTPAPGPVPSPGIKPVEEDEPEEPEEEAPSPLPEAPAVEHWSEGYIEYLDSQESVVEMAAEIPTFLDILVDLILNPDSGMDRGEATEFLLVFADYSVTTMSVDSRPSFTDVDEAHPRQFFIELAAELGLIDGYEDGSFQPDLVVNRAEVLKLVAYFFGVEVDTSLRGNELLAAYDLTENPLTDVDLDSWYAPYVIHAYANGVVSGYGDGTFGPGNEVTKAEFLKMAILYQNIGDAVQLASELE